MDKVVATCAIMFVGNFIAFPIFFFKNYYTLMSSAGASSCFVTALTVTELITTFTIVVFFALGRVDSNCDVYALVPTP